MVWITFPVLELQVVNCGVNRVNPCVSAHINLQSASWVFIITGPLSIKLVFSLISKTHDKILR